MFDKYKKPLFAFLTALVIFELFSFAAVKYFDPIINQNYFFGLYGTSFWPTLLGFLILIGFYLYLRKIGLNLVVLFTVILAAAASNLIERIIYGGVVDYISIFKFNVFNLADIVIVVSMVIIFIYAIIKKKI